MKCLQLHNKPTAEVHPGHMLTGLKEEEEEEEENFYPFSHNIDYHFSYLWLTTKRNSN
jgi:hypothetical protein